MSFSPAVSHADNVGIESQEGRMNVISAAGSHTSLSLSHAQSKRGPSPLSSSHSTHTSNSLMKLALETPG